MNYGDRGITSESEGVAGLGNFFLVCCGPLCRFRRRFRCPRFLEQEVEYEEYEVDESESDEEEDEEDDEENEDELEEVAELS